MARFRPSPFGPVFAEEDAERVQGFWVSGLGLGSVWENPPALRASFWGGWLAIQTSACWGSLHNLYSP